MLFNKDVAKIIRKLYKENYELTPTERKELDDYLSEGATIRRTYREYLHKENYKAIVKIASLLKSNKQQNSGFYFNECDSIIVQCYGVIKHYMSEEIFGTAQQKEYDCCKKVLPYICENMKASGLETEKTVEKLEEMLDEIEMDKKCLSNFKELVKSNFEYAVK